MKRVLCTLVLGLATIGMVQAQLRSFNSGIAGREEKGGSGKIETADGNLRLRRVYLRFDNNSDVYIRMYPEAFARTYSGRYYWEGNDRIHISLTQGTGHMTGFVEMKRSGGTLTFGKIRFSGETSNGSRQSVSFDPDSSSRPGSERDTPVEEWNSRWGSGNGGWGGSGGSGGWGGSGGSGSGGGWNDSLPTFDGSSAGSGRAYWGSGNRSLRRAELRVRNADDVRLKFDSSDDIEINGENARRSGDTYTFEIKRFEGRSASGRATVVVRGREIQTVFYNGRADGKSFNGTFRRD